MISKNLEKYNFNDFTTQSYRELLLSAQKNYKPVFYNSPADGERLIYWRHDVDYSMHRALRLAMIEKEESFKSTYFLLPHSEFYNLFEKEISVIVFKIIEAGHEIGLHFDSHYYGIKNENQLEKYLLREKKWLDETFNTDIKAFSFHNTNEFTMNCRQWKYAGLINTYADYFQTKIGYCSDSHGIWRFRRLKDVLEKAEDTSLQILTHPEWWVEEVMSPRQRIQKCIDGRAKANGIFYDNLIANMKRENIDW